MNPWEISAKGNPLHISTCMVEMRENGWPCSVDDLIDPVTSAADTQARADCAARNGEVMEGYTQCYCTSSKTLYPVGVEKMVMQFEHAINSLYLGANTAFSDVNHSSSKLPGEDGAVTTRVFKYDSEEVFKEFTPGDVISLTIEEWLEVGGIADINGYSEAGPADYIDGVTYPRYRTAGVGLEVVVEFHNRQKSDDKPFAPGLHYSKDIIADVRVTAEKSNWAGAGPKVHYEVYPSGPGGSQTYDKIFQYRQGVAIKFKSAGELYKFDWQYVINVLLGGLVFLFAAKAIANTAALYFLGKTSSMIRNRTRENFDINSRFAEIGMKAALAALQFSKVDHDTDAVLEVEDLVVAFARLHGITAEQAIAISKVVLAQADKDGQKVGKSAKVGNRPKKTSTTNPYDKDGLDFAEFLMAREGGQMIPFDSYLGLIEKEASKIDYQTKMTDEEMAKLFYEKRAVFHANREHELGTPAPTQENTIKEA